MAGSYSYLPLERVLFGQPAAEAAAEETARIGAQRVFIVASKSLARETPVVHAIAEALGGRYAGLFDGCVAHTPWPSVIEAANAVRAAAPDLGAPNKPSPARQIVVPTTLSGAEFSNLAGGTDPRTRLKHAFTGADIGARSVILDPAVTLHTPQWLWLSTGVRAIDHAVEALLSIDAHAYCDGLALHALRLFAEALPRTRAEPGDLDARLACQQASWLAASTIARVNYGASHGIGHALGQPDLPAADAVAALIEALGLPTTLRAVNVKRQQLPAIAEAAMKNLWVRTNPQPIRSREDVMRLLEAAW